MTVAKVKEIDSVIRSFIYRSLGRHENEVSNETAREDFIVVVLSYAPTFKNTELNCCYSLLGECIIIILKMPELTEPVDEL